MSTSAILLAAGAGRRMGAGKNKVLLRLDGRPLLAFVLDAFRAVADVSEIVLVIRRDDEEVVGPLIEGGASRIRCVEGGEMRRDSALAGVRASNGRYVLVHDGARPLVSQALIERVLEATQRHGAAIPILPVTDTLHVRNDRGELTRTIDRSAVVFAQTPQGFERELLLDALERAPGDVTDDATAVRAAGHRVFCVDGEPDNLKVTRPEDLVTVGLYLRRRAGDAAAGSAKSVV